MLYFSSEVKDPKIWVEFQNNALNEFQLFLVHRFQYQFMQIDRKASNVTEVLHCLKELVDYLKELMKVYPFYYQSCS